MRIEGFFRDDRQGEIERRALAPAVGMEPDLAFMEFDKFFGDKHATSLHGCQVIRNAKNSNNQTCCPEVIN